jgi:hypothetical protein
LRSALLCGHHYRASCSALTAARATIHELPAITPETMAWIYFDRDSSAPAASS